VFRPPSDSTTRSTKVTAATRMTIEITLALRSFRSCILSQPGSWSDRLSASILVMNRS